MTTGGCSVEGADTAACDVDPAPEVCSGTVVTETPASIEAGQRWEAVCDDEEPQRWTVPPSNPHRKVVAPPQFVDAPQHFQDALDRMEGKMLDVVLKRNKERRARAAAGWGGV